MLSSIYKDFVIHIGGVVLGTAYKVLPLFAVNQAAEGLPYLGLVQLPRDLGLYLHNLSSTTLLHFFRNIVLQLIGSGILLMAIGEAAQTLKTHLSDKLFELLEIFLCLVRITHNKSGTNGYFWHGLAEVLQKLCGLSLSCPSLHTLEDRIGNMLKGNI